MSKREDIEILNRELNKDDKKYLDVTQRKKPYYPYIEDKGNVYYLPKNKTELQYLANFTVKVFEEVKKDNGIEVSNYIKLGGKLNTQRNLDVITVPVNKVSNMSFIPEYWGMTPTIAPNYNNVSHYKAYIQKKTLIRGAQRTVYTHTGIREVEGKLCYLHSNGAVGREDINCELEGNLSRYKFVKDSYQLKDSLTKVLDLLKVGKSTITYPLISFVFLAPLNHFLDKAGYPVGFALFLKGSTGTFKTSISNLFMSFFMEYKPQQAGTTNFHSTANFIERVAFTLKDSLLWLDDYHPTNENEKRKMNQVIERVARMSGDKLSRGRLNNDTTLKASYYPRCITLITGEDVPVTAESSLARFFFVNIEKGDIELSNIIKAQKNAKEYNFVMREYIQYLIDNKDRLTEEYLQNKFLGFMEGIRDTNAHQRLNSNIAWLLLGFDMFLEFMKDNKAITDVEADNMMKSCKLILTHSAEEQTRIQSGERPVNKFLTMVRELLAKGEIFTFDIESGQADILGEDTRISDEKGFIGFHDNEYYYFFGESIYKEVVQAYKQSEGNFTVTKNSLFKELKKNNMIKTQGDRNIITKKIKGKVYRMLALKKEALKYED